METKVKLYGMTVVYNESKMIPYLMPYYERMGYDKLIIYDNESTDNTVELLKQYPFVEVRSFSTGHKKSNSVIRKMKNDAIKEFNKDTNNWMTITDFDEVIYFEDLNLKEYLQEKMDNKQYYINQCMVEPISREWPQIETGELVHKEMEQCRFWPMGHKMTLFNVGKVTSLNYDAGCHKGTVRFATRPVKSFNDEGKLFSLHLKYLDYDFNLSKNQIAASRRSDDDKKHKYGIQYEQLKTPEAFEKNWKKMEDESFPLLEYLSGVRKGSSKETYLKTL